MAAGDGRGARPAHRSPLLLGLGGVVAFVIVLELVPRVGLADARFLPPFSAIAAALAERLQTAEFWTALRQTLTTWAIGLSIAMTAGVALGLVIGSVGFLRAATASTIEFLRPVPSVALIPLAVLMFGTGRPSTLLLVVYAAFWQVLIQVLYGVQDVDPVAHDTARAYHLGLVTRCCRLVWPTTLPYAMTGFRLAATVALMLTITGELIIGTPGVGRLVAVAQQSGAVASTYGLVVVVGLLGLAVNLLARITERRVLHWHPSIRLERTG